MINIRKLESDLWESADLLRAGSKLTSNQYCMPVLGLIFLRYAYSRFKLVEAEILKNRPVRNGRVIPVEASDFTSKSALFLPKEAQYEYLVNLPADIASAGLTNQSGHIMNSLGEVVNNAMELVEAQSEQLIGVLPKDYTMFSDELLAELLDADVLVILTAVEQVAINFNKPDQKGLDDLTPAQAKVYMDENQFAKGSMLPKVQAAVKFAESKAGRTALITLLEKAKDGIEGKTGTRVHQ